MSLKLYIDELLWKINELARPTYRKDDNDWYNTYDHRETIWVILGLSHYPKLMNSPPLTIPKYLSLFIYQLIIYFF